MEAGVNQSMQRRIDSLREKLIELSLDAMMVLVEENRRYLSGFSGEDGQYDESAGALFITPDKLLLATDSRYELQAVQETEGWDVFCYKQGVAKALPDITKMLGIKRLAFESKRVSFKQHSDMQKEFPHPASSVELVATENMVEDLRVKKQEIEIQATQKALAIAESAFIKTVKSIQPGMTEKEVAWYLDKNMRESGADSTSFPTIVASGPNSALPHAIPTDRPIKEGEPVLFDWGARLDGYCSDTSRTILLGKAGERFQHVFDVVAQAQQIAIKAIHAGASTKAVDSLARQHIEKEGFAERFGHALGHGTGLAVHEPPRLSPLSDTRLETGMLVTVEPGIYLPDWGGVRLENQVVVRNNDAQVLNRLDLEIAV
jgi:Xaa-Pro aminopeptidase